MTSTSVQVALRIRPLNSKETLQNCSECLTPIPDAPQILLGTDRSFTFDHVFSSDTEQEDVFQDCARPLIDKLVEGYNVTILAYGQTGSGKTYSMGIALDSNIPAEHQGIIPRAVRKLFNDLHERKEKNPSNQFEVYVSFLELYNEDLIDLLNPQSRENNKKGKSELMIREDASGQIYWAGVKEVLVSSPDELLGQLHKGSLCRTVASTDINMVSSRSHAIFSVILKQTRIENLQENEENDIPPAESSTASKRKSKQKSLTTKVISKFHFVDLAGSERLKRTNAVGDRAKEGIAINGGLLALGNVISALGDESRKVTHVPYRDSKLTRLLQDSLGGNSQTLMLACVSPADSNFMETLNTLKYANRARNIKNKVSVNESYGGSSVEINQLREQINRLKLEIQTLRDGGCSEETCSKYEEEIKSLKGELGMAKMKLKNSEEELIKVNTEKNTLLMEISFNGQDLSEADREHKMKTHHIVQAYETEIRNLKNQIADLQALQLQNSRKSYLAGTTPGRERGHIKFSDPHIYSSDEGAHNNNNNNNNENNNKENDGGKKGKKKKKRTPKKNKTRADGHFPVSDGTSIAPSVDSSSSHQFEQPSNLEEGRFKFTRKLRRSSNIRDKLEKAKEQLRQCYLLTKNGGSLHDDPLLSQLIKQPSSTKSESYIDQMMANPSSQEKRRSSSVSSSEIQTIEVPTWQESNPPQPQTSRRASNSSRSVSFSDQPICPGDSPPRSTRSSCSSSASYSIASYSASYSSQHQNALALTRMLHQIQADIAVKEQLVSQLERAEQEYTYMRAQYKQKLADMQEALINLQRERDAAVKRSQNSGIGISTRDKNSILAELKARYEHKMKRLIQEIGELRRKYNEATQSNTAIKNQNETMLKSMRAQVEQLKAEKMRMMKRMKDETERVREIVERNQCEIQNLRCKEKIAQEQKKRLERTNKKQKFMLEKRQKEVLQTNGKLESVMALLKRSTTPKSIAKAFRSHKRNHVPDGQDGKGSRRTSDDFRAAHYEVFASGYDKKKLLDEAIYKYISGHRSLEIIDGWIGERNKLQEEKKELLEERERIINGEFGNELDGEAQGLDDKIEMMTSEITCINAKIQTLQSEAVRNVTAEQENEYCKQEKSAENSKDTDENSRAGRAEDKLSLNSQENATPETSYDIAISILRNLDPFEYQIILESFFKDIVDLRTGYLSRQITIDQNEKTILELRKKLNPITREKREQLDDVGNEAISLFERNYDQDLVQVEARTAVTPGQNESRRDSYFFDRDLSSPVTSASPMNSANSIKKRSSNGQRLNRRPNGPSILSTPSTPKDENVPSNVTNTASAHHTHTKTPKGDNVFDRLSKGQTYSSLAKNTRKVAKEYTGERYCSVTRGHSNKAMVVLEMH